MIRLAFAKIIDRKREGDYPQLWYHMPRKKNYPRLRRFLQWLCELAGHELSLTEWGYGGGDVADRWCRWCDKLIVVPKTSLFFLFPQSKSKMEKVGKNFDEYGGRIP